MRGPHSTTWADRHHQSFHRLSELLQARGSTAPLVLDIGPGAVAAILAGLFPGQAGAELSARQRWRRSLARRLDMLLRRVPWIKLHTFEPVELSRVLPPDHRLVVIDSSDRVLRAVQRALPQAQCHRLDICRRAIPYRADVIVCYNVLTLLPDGAKAFRHLLDALAGGGLLLIDNRSIDRLAKASTPLERVDDKIHLKV